MSGNVNVSLQRPIPAPYAGLVERAGFAPGQQPAVNFGRPNFRPLPQIIDSSRVMAPTPYTCNYRSEGPMRMMLQVLTSVVTGLFQLVGHLVNALLGKNQEQKPVQTAGDSQSGAVGAGSNILSALGSLFGSLQTDSAVDPIRVPPTMDPMNPMLTGGIDYSGMAGLANKAGQLNSSLDGIYNTGKKIYDGVSEYGSTVWDGVKKVGGWLGGGASSVWNGVKSVGSSLWNSASGLLGSLAGGVGSAVSSGASWLGRAAGAVLSLF